MYLNSETKALLENTIGKSIFELSQMDMNEEVDYVQKKTRKKLIFSKIPDARMHGRGNPLLARRRISTMEDVDRKIMEF